MPSSHNLTPLADNHAYHIPLTDTDTVTRCYIKFIPAFKSRSWEISGQCPSILCHRNHYRITRNCKGSPGADPGFGWGGPKFFWPIFADSAEPLLARVHGPP